MAASVLIGLVAVVAVLDAVASQNAADVVRDYGDGVATMDDVRAADAFTLAVAVPSVLVSIAAGVTFIVWLYRSRLNAERLTYGTEHRRARGWAIGAWFTPVVNFWFPYQVVQDVWRSFDPAQQDRPLQARDNNGFVLGWWLTFVAMTWGDRVVSRMVLRDGDLGAVATATWVATLVTIVAAAMAVVLVKRLTDLQDRTRPVEFSGPVPVHVPGA